MKGNSLTTSLVCLTLLGVAWGQSTSGLPKRELVITGGQFTVETYIDVGAFTAPVFPLDDREWIGTPQLSMLCYSPRVPKETFSMFTHMKDVVYPIIWYYPLDHKLGEWKYEYGDELVCQLWECDGASDGCDPARPNILPNQKAGDDLIGQATLSMGSYQILSSHLLNMTIPSNGKGTTGDQAASFLIECKGCRTLWSKDPSWVNPFTLPPKQEEKSPDVPPVSVPNKDDVEKPNTDNSPLPWREGDTKDGNENDTPESDANNEKKPPSTDEQPVKPFEGPVVPTDPDGEAKKEDDGTQEESSGGSSVLVIVLAVLGALVGLLVIAVLVYYGLKKWGWRRVDPVEDIDAADSKNSKDENVARHLRIRVQRPADADAAIRQHRADGAMAELPWQPYTKH